VKKLDSVKKPFPFIYKLLLLITLITVIFFLIVFALLLTSYFINNKSDINSELIFPLLRCLLVILPIDGLLIFVLTSLLCARKLNNKKTIIKRISSMYDLSRSNYLCIDEKEILSSTTSSIKEIVPLGKENENEIIDIIGSIASTVRDDNPVISAIQHLSYIPLFNNQKTEVDNGSYYAIYKEDKFALGHINSFKYRSEEFIKTKAEPYLLKGYEILLVGKFIFDKQNNKYAEFADIFGIIVAKNEINHEIKDAILFLQDKDVEIKLLTSSSPFGMSEIAKNIGIKNAEKYINNRNNSTIDNSSINDYCVIGGLSLKGKEKVVSILQRDGGVVTTLSNENSIANSNCSISLKEESNADIVVNSKELSLIDLIKESSIYNNKLRRVGLMMFYRLVFSTLFIVASAIMSVMGYSFDYRSVGIGIVVIILLSVALLFIKDDGGPIGKAQYKAIVISILSLFSISIIFAMYFLQLNQLIYTGINSMQTCYSMCGVIFVLLIPFVLLSSSLPLDKKRVLPFAIMVGLLVAGVAILWWVSVYLNQGILGLCFNLFNGQNILSIGSIVVMFVSIYFIVNYLIDNYNKEDN